jgi:phage terminase small subunit
MDKENEEEYKLDIPDESLQEITEHCPQLTEQEKRYVYFRITGSNAVQSFSKAGYKGSTWKTVELRPKIREAIATMVEVTSPDHRVSQKTVVGILMEAVEVARRKDQAHNLITAARNLSDILGHTASQKIEMNQRIDSKVEHEHTLSLKHFDKTMLERFLELDRLLPSKVDVIEGEYSEVKRIEHK